MASGSGVSVAQVPVLASPPGPRPSLHPQLRWPLGVVSKAGDRQPWSPTQQAVSGHFWKHLVFLSRRRPRSLWVSRAFRVARASVLLPRGAPVGPPGPGELCPEDLGWILRNARRGLERRPQRGQRGIQSGSGWGPSSALATWSSGHCQPPQPHDCSGGARLWSPSHSARTGALRGQHGDRAPQQAAGSLHGSQVPPPTWPWAGGSACRAIWRLPSRSWRAQALRGLQPEKKTSWHAGSQAWPCPPQPGASSECRSQRRASCPGRSGALRGGLLPTRATPSPVLSQSSCHPGEVAPGNPGLWTPRGPV